MSLEKHKALTAVRARAYGDLFGCKPSERVNQTSACV
jgi:hypothetical protein